MMQTLLRTAARLGFLTTVVVSATTIAATAAHAQTRGGTLNFVVTPEPTALVASSMSRSTARSRPSGSQSISRAITDSRAATHWSGIIGTCCAAAFMRRRTA
jgi:hypothetical protein